MAGTGEYWNGIPFTSRARPTTWAMRLSGESPKAVIGVVKAFGTSTSPPDRISILYLADRFVRTTGSRWF